MKKTVLGNMKPRSDRTSQLHLLTETDLPGETASNHRRTETSKVGRENEYTLESKCEGLTTALRKVPVLWAITLYRLEYMYKRLEGSWCLRLQGSSLTSLPSSG